MFLNQLENHHKKSMLDLVWLIINCDDDIDETELNMLENFKFEMRYFAKPELRNLDEILVAFQGASRMIKRIVMLECAGMVLADDFVAEEEKEILNKIAKTFRIEESSISTTLDIVKQLLLQQQRAIKFISG